MSFHLITLAEAARLAPHASPAVTASVYADVLESNRETLGAKLALAGFGAWCQTREAAAFDVLSEGGSRWLAKQKRPGSMRPQPHMEVGQRTRR
jgi:hypothetical protein